GRLARREGERAGDERVVRPVSGGRPTRHPEVDGGGERGGAGEGDRDRGAADRLGGGEGGASEGDDRGQLVVGDGEGVDGARPQRGVDRVGEREDDGLVALVDRVPDDADGDRPRHLPGGEDHRPVGEVVVGAAGGASAGHRVGDLDVLGGGRR